MLRAFCEFRLPTGGMNAVMPARGKDATRFRVRPGDRIAYYCPSHKAALERAGLTIVAEARPAA